MQTSSRKWWWLILTLGATLVLTLGIACGGGDDDDDDDGGSATATEEADDSEETPDEGDDEETDEPTEDAGDGDGGDSDDALQDLLDAGANIEGQTGQVTYEFTTTAAGSSTTSTMTYYVDPPNSRVDFSGEGSNIIVINTSDASYTCIDSGGGDGLCYEGEGGTGANLLPVVEQWTDADQLAAYLNAFTDTDVEFFDDEIAGLSASCYTVSEGDLTAGTFCFADDSGLMLLASSEFAGSSYEMRATEASDSVSGDVFTPPYEIFSFGT